MIKLTGLQEIIEQLESLLSDVTTAEYRRPLELFEGASIGKHVRHIYEFYFQLFEGLDEGLVNYSDRKREQRIETNKEFALSRLRILLNKEISESDERILKVLSETNQLSNSSLGRELMFVYDHAVHHLAIIRIGIRHHFEHCEFDPDIGFSKATLRHQQNCGH